MVAAAMKHMASNFAKLDKFERVDFRRWQKKKNFLLSSMSVVYVLTTPIPEDGGDDATMKQIRKRAKWNNDDYVCRELLDSLEAKYMAEDASSKKFLFSNFTNYKIIDSRPVIEQYNKLLGILGRFTQHKMNMDEAIQVFCIIYKLTPSLKDFKHTLKHKNDELTLVKLGSHLRIEESLRVQDSDKLKGNNVAGLKAVVRLPDPKLKTLGERGIECIFVGYAEHSNAFKFYVIEPNDSVSINSIIESRDAIFNENRISSLSRPSLRIPNGTEDIGGSVVPEEVTEEDEVSDQHSYCFNVEDDPKIFDEAMKSQDVTFWKEAINDEMDSIMGNNTWVLADLPPSCKPFGCKWIFKRKLKVYGAIEKFKVRLVIQGFKQKSRINYFDTYALVARISIIKLLIAMTSIHNLIIHHMDVKTTFLNGDLDEENQKFDEVVLSNGYLLNQADKCVYSKFDETVLYEGHGEADVILGIRIKHESNGIAISQSYYIEKVLKKFNYFDCTPVSIPMDTSEKLMPNNGQTVSQLKYSRVIDCLMYDMTCTRPDIAFAVGKLSRLTYTGYPSVLEGYTDASWISNTEDNSSTSGWVFLKKCFKFDSSLENRNMNFLNQVR
ncbi:zinc finger, CCHC-type containing protein [Tanacetum coccineum]